MNKQSDNILPLIDSFEEYEHFKAENINVLEKAARSIMAIHDLPDEPLSLFVDGTNVVFAYGKTKVIKISPPFHREQFNSEILVLRFLQNKLSVKTPNLQFAGEISGWSYLVISQLDGTLLESLWETMEHKNKIIIMQQLGALIREVHALTTEGLESIDCHWPKFIENQMRNCVIQHQSTHLAQVLINQVPEYINSIKPNLLKIGKPVLLTGEYTLMNFLVKQVSGVWHVDGLIDFGDAMLGLPEYDLLGPGAFLIQGDKELLKVFLMAYGYSAEMLTQNLSHKMTALMLLHLYSNLEVQVRVKDWKDKVKNLQELEDLVWGFNRV